MLLAALAASAVTAACPANVAGGLDLPAATKQLLTVETAVARTTYATAQRWQRGADGCWFRVGAAQPARVGRNGVKANRREGDGTTPVGTFPIGRTMYGTEPNPGVRYAYRRLRCGDWWDEDPRSPTYNRFVHVRCGTRPPFRTTTPGMWEQPRPFPHLAVVEFNMRPIVPGRGSGIFLHAQTGGPTNGCVSLRRGDLVTTLRWLRPAHAPRIAIGTSATLRR